MEGDTETVGLVTEVLNDPESLARLVDLERHTVAGDINFLQSFRDAHD